MADVTELMDGKVVKTTRQPTLGFVHRVIERSPDTTRRWTFQGTGQMSLLPVGTSADTMILGHGNLVTFAIADDWQGDKAYRNGHKPGALQTAWSRWALDESWAGNKGGVDDIVSWLWGGADGSDSTSEATENKLPGSDTIGTGVQIKYFDNFRAAKNSVDIDQIAVYADRGMVYVLMTEAHKEILTRRMNALIPTFFHMTPQIKHIGLGELKGQMRDMEGELQSRRDINKPTMFVSLDPAQAADTGKSSMPFRCEIDTRGINTYEWTPLKRKMATNTLYYRLLWEWIQSFGLDDGLTKDEFEAGATMMLASYGGFGTASGPVDLGAVGGENLAFEAFEFAGLPFASTYQDLDPALMTMGELKHYICLLMAMKIATTHGTPWLSEFELRQTSLHKPNISIQRLDGALHPDWDMGASVGYFLPVPEMSRASEKRTKEYTFCTLSSSKRANMWSGQREARRIGDISVNLWEGGRTRAELAVELKPWETAFSRPVVERDGVTLEVPVAFRVLTMLGLPRPMKPGGQVPMRALLQQFTIDAVTVDGWGYLVKARQFINSAIMASHLAGANNNELVERADGARSINDYWGEPNLDSLVVETIDVVATDPFLGSGESFVTAAEAMKSTKRRDKLTSSGGFVAAEEGFTGLESTSEGQQGVAYYNAVQARELAVESLDAADFAVKKLQKKADKQKADTGKVSGPTKKALNKAKKVRGDAEKELESTTARRDTVEGGFSSDVKSGNLPRIA